METKGVTCKIPLELHNRISEEIRETESTMSKFIERIITEHYEKGAVTVMGKGRTLAFQVIENAISTVPAPSKAETVHSEQSTTELKADEKSTENSSEVNFTLGWEKALEEPAMEKNLSGTSSPSKSSWPGLTNHKESSGKPSVKKLLQEIRREQTEKKAKKAKQQERRYPAPGHSHKKVKKQKGRTSI